MIAGVIVPLAVLATATSAVSPSAVVRTAVPVSELRASDLLFACGEKGLPSVNIKYDGTQRYLDFAQFGVDSVTLALTDAVKSVVHEGGEQSDSWLIAAEGLAHDTKGSVADGTPVTMDLAIHSRPTGTTMDFTVRAASFSRTGTGCRLMPPRPKRSGTAQ